MSVTALLKLLDLVPSWVWAALLALAVAFGAVTSVRLSAAHGDLAAKDTTIAQMTAKEESDRANREHVARVDAEQVAKAEFRHAEVQQENSNEFAKRAAARAAADAARVADDQRLRNDILAAPSGGGEGQVDAATCRRDGDLARQLGADLAEAVGLQDEAEAALRRRDDEVRLLLQQITIDRAAVEAAQ